MKDLLPHIQFLHGTIGENQSNLKLNVFALVEAPEIIEVNEPASKHIFAKTFRFLLAQRQPSSRFDDIQIGILEELRIHDGDRMRRAIVNADSGEALHAPHELAIGCRIVRCPGSVTCSTTFAALQRLAGSLGSKL